MFSNFDKITKIEGFFRQVSGLDLPMETARLLSLIRFATVQSIGKIAQLFKEYNARNQVLDTCKYITFYVFTSYVL